MRSANMPPNEYNSTLLERQAIVAGPEVPEAVAPVHQFNELSIVAPFTFGQYDPPRAKWTRMIHDLGLDNPDIGSSRNPAMGAGIELVLVESDLIMDVMHRRYGRTFDPNPKKPGGLAKARSKQAEVKDRLSAHLENMYTSTAAPDTDVPKLTTDIQDRQEALQKNRYGPQLYDVSDYLEIAADQSGYCLSLAASKEFLHDVRLAMIKDMHTILGLRPSPYQLKRWSANYSPQVQVFDLYDSDDGMSEVQIAQNDRRVPNFSHLGPMLFDAPHVKLTKPSVKTV